MQELLLPASTVLLVEGSNPDRRTDYDLVAVQTPSGLVSVDSRVPNAVVAEALDAGAIPDLAGFYDVRREVPWGSSRIDFLLEGPEGRALVEVKGCTLVEPGGLALFPDAPTARGARHVRELAQALEGGVSSFVVIIIQRGDGRVFAPNDRTDPAFGDALREASVRGVGVMAFTTRVTREGVDLMDPIPVDLEATMEAT
jgi:sugar fermentation stimulation protein A